MMQKRKIPNRRCASGTITPIPIFAPVDRPEVADSTDVMFPELGALLVATERLLVDC
jgi:hypothetical protein